MIIKSEQDEIQNYLSDASNTKGYCSAVWIPESIEELAEAVGMSLGELDLYLWYMKAKAVMK